VFVRIFVTACVFAFAGCCLISQQRATSAEICKSCALRPDHQGAVFCRYADLQLCDATCCIDNDDLEW
jgi:hypothetical protein